MLLTYFVLILLMFVVLVIAGVLGFVFRAQVETNLRPEMLYSIEEYDPDDPSSPMTSAWDNTQRHVSQSDILG